MSHQDEGDLTLLQQMDEQSLSDYLINRLNSSQPFTNLGSNGLVVVNPHRELGLFTHEISNHYIENGYKSHDSTHSRLVPHVYDIATKVYFHMRRLGTDHSIVFCGPANSGKSYSYRETLNQLSKLALNPKKPPKVPDQLLHLLNVVESFSKCSASNNPNASRSGLYQELQFTNRGRIAGIKTISYYFEKSRLTCVPPQEGNFDIFYQFIKNATFEERSQYYLDDTFTYLPNSISPKQGGYDNINIQESLKAINFKSKARAKINQLLATILHLGNLDFASAGEGQEVYIKNHDTLELIAGWLGVGSSDLGNVFSSKTQLVGKELCTVLMDAAGASQQRDHLAVTLYSLLFTWIVEAINSRFCDDDNTASYIALLDQISFEPHKINALDQFCRNFTNERIRHFTLNYLLSNETSFRSELIQDGLQLPDHLITTFPSAANLLVGEDGESGMVEAIDRHCHKSANRRGEDQLLNTLNKSFSNIPEYLQTNPASHSFTISHYETNIEYHLYQFVDNNLDSINADFVKLFQSDSDGYSHCSNPFLVELFQSEAVMTQHHQGNPDVIVSAQSPSAPMRKPSRKHVKRPTEKSVPEVTMPTRVAQINSTLNDLFATLETTRIWPVFHINPYSGYSNQTLDQSSVVAQIKSWSLPSLAANMALDLSTSFTFDEFLTRYHSVTNSIGLDASRDSKSQIDAFATISGLIAGSDYVLGNNKIFLSFSKWKDLEDSLRSTIRDEKSPAIDQSYLGFPRHGDDDSIYSGYDGNRNIASPSQFPGQLYEGEEIGNRNLKNVGGYGNFGAGNDDDNGSVMLSEKQASLQAPIQTSETVKAVELADLSPESQAKTLKGKKEKKIETKPLTFARKSWVRLTWFLTWWIPSCCLSRCGKMTRPDVQMAWREKVAICTLIFLSWCILLFMNIGLGLIFCPPEEAFQVDDLAKAQGKSAVAYMYGNIYDLVKLAKFRHAKSPRVPDGVTSDDMEPLEGKDITSLFPLDPKVYCQGLDNIPDNYAFNWRADTNYMEYNTVVASQDFDRWVHSTNSFKGQTVSTDPLWYKNTALPYLKGLRTGTVVYPKKVINQYRDWQWNLGVINGKVYDISIYVNNTRSDTDKKWMPPEVVDIFKFSVNNDVKNGDITELWNGIKFDSPEKKEAVMTCLNNLFYVGKIDPTELISCQVTNILLLVFSGIALSVAAVKFLAALQLSGKRDPQDYDKFVILQVPCYTEGEESIRRTLESLAVLQYSDKHKLIFVIADGMIIGGGNDLPTPRIVLNVLGVDPKLEPESFAFKSLGEGSKQLNYGKVYTGLYEIEGHSVPYVVVVKVGSPKEVSRPGNRGKRDSQIILMQFLNRVHFDTPMTPLELEMYHQMKNVIGVDPKLYEYILMVDADTEVLPDSLNRLVAVMARDASVMGLCGETTLVNENQSITTMMQVYEYYISHHLAKAFESLFGSVTCLPGCFSMYRIKSVRNAPLIISNKIIELYSENEVDTLHKKNLLSLGEDRYLTTLMLQQFPANRMKFTPDATCRTVVPERFDILLSQRRRWINSTIHNLFELLWLKDMCGFCCFSMRFVVLLDLVGTLILPASVIYLIYIIVAWATEFQKISYISIIIMASIYILQALLFIIKQKWEHIGWMIFYLLAIPLFNFYIPIYSYWHFDDFSWGNTRVVVGDGKKQVISEDEVPFDPESVPLKTWAEHEQQQWEKASQESRGHSALGYNPAYNTSSGYLYPPPGTGGNSPSRSGSPSPYGAGSRANLLMPDPNRPITPQFMPDQGRPMTPQYMAPGARASTYSHAYSMAEPRGQGQGYYPSPSQQPLRSPGTPQPMYLGSPATPTMFDVADETLASEIRFILSTNDLGNITKKQVRAKLQESFQMDLSHKKDFINATIDSILNQQQ